MYPTPEVYPTPDVYPTPEEAAAHEYTPMEREVVRGWTSAHIVGSPATVRTGLLDLAQRTRADELMITTMIHSPDDRLESYRLVADVMGLQPDEQLGSPAGDAVSR